MIIFKKIYVVLSSTIFGGVVAWFAANSTPSILFMDKSNAAITRDKNEIYDDILKKELEIKTKIDQLFEDDFLIQDNLYKKMQLMREEMNKRIQKITSDSILIENLFDLFLADKFGTKMIKDIFFSEDKEFISYEIILADLDSTLISTVLDRGFVTIFGTTKQTSLNSDFKTNGSSFSHSYYNATFRQMLPLPRNTDINNMTMQMNYKKNKVKLKFPKTAG